jgi:hypothetical protein
VKQERHHNAIATATVVVANTIDAVNDPSYNVPAASSLPVGNVTTNDTLNGVLVTSANTDVTPITTGPLSVDANGVVTLAATHQVELYYHLPIM